MASRCSVRSTKRLTLREISPTVDFNVPEELQILAQSMQQDETLRANFYRRLQACFFGGAALSQHTWDLLDAQSNAEWAVARRCCRSRRDGDFAVRDVHNAGQ